MRGPEPATRRASAHRPDTVRPVHAGRPRHELASAIRCACEPAPEPSRAWRAESLTTVSAHWSLASHHADDVSLLPPRALSNQALAQGQYARVDPPAKGTWARDGHSGIPLLRKAIGWAPRDHAHVEPVG